MIIRLNRSWIETVHGLADLSEGRVAICESSADLSAG